MKRFLIATAAMMAATPAFAQTTTTNGAEVDFDGNRATVCEVQDYDGTIDFGTLDNVGNAGAQSDSFAVFCNVRFDASVASNNGYLRHQASNATAQNDMESSQYGGFAAGVDYSVAITSTGNYGALAANANTGQIPGGNSPVVLGTNFNPINQNVNVVYDTIPGTLPLLGGNYSDTITLTLAPVGW